MGYACPVCETPQADARHLANHLAFTAMLHGDEHETWLDEHAPGWEEAGEHPLADRVRELAESADYPQVFEDTAGRMNADHGHAGDAPDERSGALFDDDELNAPAARDRTDADAANLDEETEAVLEKARDLTRQMLDEADDQDVSDE